MHQILHTRAFVLSALPLYEADKILKLLTENYGVIRVVAQGIRKNESKLQQSVQQFSLVNVAMIQGKTGWRLTNAEIEKNYFYLLDSNIIKMVGRIFSMIERMIPDEDSSPIIFQTISEMFILFENQLINITNDYLQNIEVATLGKIMFELGYVGDETLRQELGKTLPEIIKNAELNKKSLIKVINNAINESQL